MKHLMKSRIAIVLLAICAASSSPISLYCNGIEIEKPPIGVLDWPVEMKLQMWQQTQASQSSYISSVCKATMGHLKIDDGWIDILIDVLAAPYILYMKVLREIISLCALTDCYDVKPIKIFDPDHPDFKLPGTGEIQKKCYKRSSAVKYKQLWCQPPDCFYPVSYIGPGG